MAQAQIVLFPINEKTTLSELPDAFEMSVAYYEERTVEAPPLLIFEPCEMLKFPGFRLNVSEAPEELLVVCINPLLRQAIFDALERVQAREPKFANSTQTKSLKIKQNTPLKSVYRQMSEMLLTVFSMTFPIDDDVTIFFLRTPFTVSEFRREIEKPIV